MMLAHGTVFYGAHIGNLERFFGITRAHKEVVGKSPQCFPDCMAAFSSCSLEQYMAACSFPVAITRPSQRCLSTTYRDPDVW